MVGKAKEEHGLIGFWDSEDGKMYELGDEELSRETLRACRIIMSCNRDPEPSRVQFRRSMCL